MKETDDLVQFIDNGIRLEDDFCSHANGKWLKETAIPEDKTLWNSFTILGEKTLLDTKLLMESNEFIDDDFKKIKRFYNEGIDRDKRNRLDVKPIIEYLEKIYLINTKDALINVLLLFAEKNIPSVFDLTSRVDLKDTSREIPHIFSTGLSLPILSFGSKEYYLDDDKKGLREKYIEYIASLFDLIGLSDVEEKGKAVLEFETKLAEKHFSSLQKRDYDLLYNAKDSIQELQNFVPNFPWTKFFKIYTNKEIKKLILDNPEYLKLINDLLDSSDLNQWKLFLTAKLVNYASLYLSDSFIQANFNFYGKIIRGTQNLEEYDKQIVSIINNRQILGELVGKYYIQKYFSKKSKEKITDLVTNLKEVMAERINNLDWMSSETKVHALDKLQEMRIRVGYPDTWEEYTNLQFSNSDSFFDIVNKSSFFVHGIIIANIYNSPNLNHWSMTPQTVNASNGQPKNEISFPAGILQHPFFDLNNTDAENYGAIGVTIGHEITHSFDDKGSLFDNKGNRFNWWTEQDKKRFDEKAGRIAKEYDQFILNGKPLNGKLKQGEGISDLGGISIAFQALQLNYEKKGKREDDGLLSSEQKFFYAFARCLGRDKMRPEFEKIYEIIPVAPGKARVNISLANLPGFQKAFSLKKGDKMYRENPIQIW